MHSGNQNNIIIQSSYNMKYRQMVSDQLPSRYIKVEKLPMVHQFLALCTHIFIQHNICSLDNLLY